MAEVETEVRNRTLVVSINRPEVRNAVDGPTARALARTFREFDTDDGLDVAILCGAGRVFCAGADLKAMADDPARANDVSPDGDAPMGPTRLELSKPVIAAVEGHAVAGGLELALWCDLRVAARSAVLGFFNRRWGVPLIDGGTIRLPRLIGHGRALDLILTGRPVNADEALRIGLVERVVDDGETLDAALTLAAELSAYPQTGLRSDRRSAVQQWGLTTAVALENEFRLGMETVASGEAQEGGRRFLSSQSKGTK